MKIIILLFKVLSLGYCTLLPAIDHLSLITHITNAISIQADILHDNLHYPKVISALLKVEEAQLIRILEANTSEVLSVIRGIDENAEKLNLSDIINLQKKREGLLYLGEKIDNLKNWENWEKLSTDKFRAVISEQAKNFTLNLDCSVTETIIDFWEISENKKVGDKELITEKFKENKENVKNCFNGLQNHKKLLEDTILREFKEIQKIKEIIDFLKFYKDQKSLSWNSDSIFSDIKAKIDEIPKFRALIARKAGQKLSVILSPITADKEEVFGFSTEYPDFNNNWFQENFANLSVNDNDSKMREALEGFTRFSDKIKELSVIWKEFINLEIDKTYGEALSKLDNLSIDKEAADKADKNWTACHRFAVTSAITLDSSEFDTAYQSWEKVISGVKEVIDNIDKLPDKRILIRYLDNPDSGSYQSFSNASESLKKILDLQGDLITDIEGSAQKTFTSIDFSSHLKNSKLLEVLKCFKNNHVDLQKVSKSLDFLQEAQNLQNQDSTETLQFLEKSQDFESAYQSTKITPITMINPIFHLINYQWISKSITESVKVLRDINIISQKGGVKVNDKLNWTLISGYDDSGQWRDPGQYFPIVVENLIDKNQSFLSVISVFDQFSNFKGFPVEKSHLKLMSDKLREDGYVTEAAEIDKIRDLNLDFSRASLKDGKKAVIQMRQFFNDTFHLNPREDSEVSRIPISYSESFIESVILIIIFLSVPIICWFFIFGDVFGILKTSERILNQKKKPDEKTLERRWRYSLFTDRTSTGDNVLFDAIRRGDHCQLEKFLKKGAYVNCYDALGNTPLHLSISLGDSEAIQLLIHAGADKKLLNADNKSPDQLTTLSDKIFPLITPDKFPIDKFKIYLDPRISDELKYWFKDRFLQNLLSDPGPSMTHYIVKTSEEGILETEDVELLIWIFSGIIIVNDQWIIDCLKNDKVISKDYQYLVDKVSYQGNEYKTVLEWSRARAKGEFPFLHGFDVVITIKSQRKINLLNRLITSLGATVLPAPLPPSAYNPGYHPILHQSMGPVLIIADKTDKKFCDKKIYTTFTEHGFMEFLLKKEIERNEEKNPIRKYRK